MPLFSIIIPVFNRSKILSTAIDSVLKQSYQDYELVIVDDGSQDNTREVVQTFNDPRIKYIYQENKGVCAARNTGISNAEGFYITFLDSDDKVEPEWLNDFYQFSINKTADIVFCDMKVYIWDGRVKVNKAQFRYNKEANNNGMFMPGTFCIQSELLKSFGGFDERIRFGEFTDMDFILQDRSIIRSFTNKVGLHYYPALNGGGRNQNNKIEALKYLLNKHAGHFKKNKNSKRLYLQNIAVSYLRMNNFSQARIYFLKSFFINPFMLKTLLRLILSFSPYFSKKIWKFS